MRTTVRTTQNRLPPPLRCSRCEFPSSSYVREEAAGLLLRYTARWQRVLALPDAGRRRGDTAAWSPLEHGCHVRDMCLLFDQQLSAMLGFAPMTVRAAGEQGLPPRYRDEDAGRVREELGRASETLAGHLAGLTADDWGHRDPRLPELGLTVDYLTRHLLHDIVHDLPGLPRRTRECSTHAEPHRAAGTTNGGRSWSS